MVNNKNLKTNEQQKAELHTKIWAIANDMRSTNDASETEQYILGLIFYRYMSEHLVQFINNELKDKNITYCKAWENSDFHNDITSKLIEGIGYVIKPEFLWSELVNLIKNGKFDTHILENAITDFSKSTIGSKSQECFKNLFDNVYFISTKFGKLEEDRIQIIEKIILKINDIDFDLNKGEVGAFDDAYEYLIGQLAATIGKTSAAFYTPPQISKLLAKIVTIGKEKLENVYDPTCGTGSLLLSVNKETKVSKFYGQEISSKNCNLAKTNMLIHQIQFSRFDIANGDTLEQPSPLHMKMKFDAVVANPPYSIQWSANESFMNDKRFSDYGKLAPKSKADYAFIQHMIYLLSNKGTMAVVLPHGVLFRGGSEGIIRKYLIDNKNYLDAVIGLPANLHYDTSISTCVLVFKKCKENEDIFFIDASKEFEAGKYKNKLTDKYVQKIIETYIKREDVNRYAYKAPLSEIKENDYNLNIARYVDTFEEEKTMNIDDVKKEVKELELKIVKMDEKINKFLK